MMELFVDAVCAGCGVVDVGLCSREDVATGLLNCGVFGFAGLNGDFCDEDAFFLDDFGVEVTAGAAPARSSSGDVARGLSSTSTSIATSTVSVPAVVPIGAEAEAEAEAEFSASATTSSTTFMSTWASSIRARVSASRMSQSCSGTAGSSQPRLA